MHTRKQWGISLIELIVFIVVISVSLVGILAVFNQSILNSVDPLMKVTAIELAQAKLDTILARKYDANSPTGGVPACGSAEFGAVPCAGIVPDVAYDDVGDYNGEVDSSNVNYTLTITVEHAGTDLGLVNDQARKITVTVAMPNSESLTLAAYKVNF